MIPIVKNITFTHVEKIDTNKDGKITPKEIKTFWTMQKNSNLRPDEDMIKRYIIDPAFKDGIMKTETSEFISSLYPNKDQSMIINITRINQGIP